MMDYNYFKKINGTYGFKNSKEKKIADMTKEYNDSYEKTIRKFDVLVNSLRGEDIKINNVLTRVVVDYKRIKEPMLNAMVREIWTHQGQMKHGDYVEYLDKNNGQTNTYLIKSKIEFREGYDSAYMQVCNNDLRIKVGSDILIIKTIAYANAYTLDEGKVINIPDNRIMCEVGYTEIDKIKYIKESGTPTRFIMSGSAWQVYGIDKITKMIGNQGLYLIKLESCALLPEDDLVNGLAHNESIALETPIIPTNMILSGDNKLYLNTTKTYTITYEGGSPIENTFNFAFSISDVSLATIVSSTNNSVTLKANGVLKGYVDIIATEITSGDIVSKNIWVRSLI